MSNNKVKMVFRAPTFLEYFDTFDDEILIEMAENHPETLKRMCSLMTLDSQLEKERVVRKPLMNEYLA
tara:strand:- start:231 stop:434 length:204 start_codon:yes stop_codon:yes gene_type:complete